ncbi:MAG TPA: hypothetical protein VGO47_05475 [Chlamydiales bacterium]|nr:hypothetical protein [Chlamydiales bacterium]
MDNNHDSRPWEIPLFTICAKDNPDFKVPVLAPTGLPRLIKSLQNLLDVPLDERSWENIVLTVRCLTFIAEYEWIAEEGALGEDAIEALVRIVR